VYVSKGSTAAIDKALLTEAQIELIIPGRFAKDVSVEDPLKHLSPLNLCSATGTESFEIKKQPIWMVYLGQAGGLPADAVGSEAFLSTAAGAMPLGDGTNQPG
jgi:hypothetical protein